MASIVQDSGTLDVDATVLMAPDADGAARKQALKERLTAHRRKEAKPLIYNPSQHSNNRPHFSLALSGPSIISPDSTHYPLEVTLHYHIDPSITAKQQQHVSFRTFSTPLARSVWVEFCYTLYSSPSLDFDSIVRFRRGGPCLRRPRTKDGRFEPRPHDWAKFPTTPEEGFVQVAPGADLVFNLNLKLDFWLNYLQPAKTYVIQFTGKEDVIKYWRYGSLQELDGQMCDLVADVGLGKGITLSHSNPVAFTIEPWRLTERQYEAESAEPGEELEG